MAAGRSLGRDDLLVWLRMKIQRHRPALLLLLAAWAAAYAASLRWAGHEAVFMFSWFVLPATAPFVAWGVGAVASAAACDSGRATTSHERSREWLLSGMAALVCVASYVLCLVVLTRLLELPWRAGKFGEYSLSLGLGAARLYAGLALGVGVAALVLWRAAVPGSRHARYAAAGIGRLVFASLCYAAFGLSPLVDWRG